MRIAICPGSFDPVTKGHIDIFERTAKMFDRTIIAVFNNPNKKPMFTMEERADMLKFTTQHIPNIEVSSFSGLLNEFAKEQGAHAIVRGLRALTDFEYEFQRALMSKKLDANLETIFMMTSSEYSFISSSGIKELAHFGGCVKGLVPEYVEHKLKEKIYKDR